MMDTMAAPQLLTIAVSLLAGLGFGLLYFRAMRASVQRLLAGASPGKVAGLTLARIAIAGAFASLLALWGAAALLAGFAGFLAARALALRAARRQA